MKRIILAALAASVLGAAAYVHAGDGAQCNHKRQGHFVGQLGLTEAQASEFRQIHEQLGDAVDKRAMHGYRGEIMALDPASSDYAAQLDALATEKAEAARAAVLAMGKAHGQVYQLLTPEQWEKAKEMHSNMQEKIGGKRWQKHRQKIDFMDNDSEE